MQLTAQMELIKVQNEKLLEGEHHLNEMKLRLLVKFDQIKLLEDFYNRHSDSQQHMQLDMELDDEQLKAIVDQLHLKFYPQGRALEADPSQEKSDW